jgi:hypothetical protein
MFEDGVMIFYTFFLIDSRCLIIVKTLHTAELEIVVEEEKLTGRKNITR